MIPWKDIGRVDEIPAGTYKVIDVDDVAIAVFNVGGEFYAIEDVCTHDGAELTGGSLDGDEITCPRHGARFSVRSGEALTPPAYEPTRAFPVRVEDGLVQVETSAI